MDSLEISLFEEIDACYTYDHDSPIKHHPKHNQTKKKQKVEIKWDTVVYDDLCYEVYDGPVLLDDINYNTTENYYERGKYVIMIPIIIKKKSGCSCSTFIYWLIYASMIFLRKSFLSLG